MKNIVIGIFLLGVAIYLASSIGDIIFTSNIGESGRARLLFYGCLIAGIFQLINGIRQVTSKNTEENAEKMINEPSENINSEKKEENPTIN